MYKYASSRSTTPFQQGNHSTTFDTCFATIANDLAAEELYHVTQDLEPDGWKRRRLPELLKAVRDNRIAPSGEVNAEN